MLLRAGSVLAAFVIAVLAFLAISRDLTSFMRNEREARYLITPGNYLYGLAVNSVHRVEDAHAAARTRRHGCTLHARVQCRQVRGCWCW